MSVESTNSASGTGLSQISHIDEATAEQLQQAGIEAPRDILENQERVEVLFRDDEMETVITEIKQLVESLDFYNTAAQEHAQWHDEMVAAGHDPVTEIDSVQEIDQPAGRPRENKPVEEFAGELADTFRELGYESGADFNRFHPADLPDGIDISNEEAWRVADAGRTAYYGYPVLEDVNHPLVPDKESYRHLWTRRTLSGARDRDAVCEALAQNEFPVCLVGYPAVGKTYLIAHICAMTNRPMVSIDMDSSLLTEDVLGFHTPTDGMDVEFTRGIFPKAFRYGWHLNINELPAASAGVWLAMHQMTERNPRLFLREAGERLKPHPAFRVTGTRNPQTDAFAGQGDTNEASMSRWEDIWIDYLSKRDERDLIDHIVNSEERIVSKAQIEHIVELAAEEFRPGVEDPTVDPSDPNFKNHILYPDTRQNRFPRLSTRHLIQMCLKSARTGANLQRSVTAVVRTACDPSDNIEAAVETAKDVSS